MIMLITHGVSKALAITSLPRSIDVQIPDKEQIHYRFYSASNKLHNTIKSRRICKQVRSTHETFISETEAVVVAVAVVVAI